MKTLSNAAASTKGVGSWHSILAMILVAILLAGCASATPEATPLPSSTPSPSANSLDDLINAAQVEGRLTAIALPDTWCNYGEVIRGFETKYGIEVTVLNPYGSSGDELDAVRAYRDTGVGDAPDVLDVGYAFGPLAQEEGLLAPYQVQTWDSIPEALKDPAGYWVGDYYGVLAFEVNTDLVQDVPQDWADLLSPQYRGQVALTGDPRSSNQAILSVYAAALAHGGSLDDALPGLEFFRQLHEVGNLVPVIANTEQIMNGMTPIVIHWDYLALGDRDALQGATNIEVVLPQSGLIGGLYVQAISAYAPHPKAARLWMEYLYSDEGQILWLKGYCHPIRFNDLVARQIIPQNLMGMLPPAELYQEALFPTLSQLDHAQETITGQWDALVGVDIIRP